MKSVFIFYFSILGISLKGQIVSIKFDSLIDDYKDKVYLINVNKIGGHTVGSKKNLVDSFLIEKKSISTYKITSKIPEGFYRIQVIPSAMDGHSFSTKLLNSTYIYINQKTKLQIKFSSQLNLHSYTLVSNNLENKNLYRFLKPFFKIQDSVLNAFNSGIQFDLYKYKKSYLHLLVQNYTRETNEVVKLFIANELATFQQYADELEFRETIPSQYAYEFSKKFKKTNLYENFINEFEELSSKIDLQLLKDIVLLNKDSIQVKNDLQNNKTVVHFWASWCKPCRYDNINLLPQLQNKLNKDSIRIVNISLDEKFTNWIKASFQDKISVENYMVDENSRKILQNKMKIISLPRVIIFDKGFKSATINCNMSDVERILKK